MHAHIGASPIVPDRDTNGMNVLASAPRRHLLLLGALLVLPGCGKFKRWLGIEDRKKPPEETKAEEPESSTPDLGGGSLPPEPLVRAERKLRFPGKSGEHMGFSLAKLAKQRALAGAIEVPEWSDPGEGADRLVRDDDLRTAWSCDPGPETSCAIGIHFPEPAEVEAVRIFAATPETHKNKKKPHSRPSVMRIHTDEGWAEVRFADEDRLWHGLLGEPTRTRNLTVEFTQTHGDGPIHLAELEVYGRGGIARSPLTVDTSRRAVSFEPPVWRKKSRTNSAGVAFIEEIDIDGRARRLLPGTALFGQTSDRLLLVERATWTTCDDHQGSYLLLDTKTRMLVPLGDMGGFAGMIFRHVEGIGFAVGDTDIDSQRLQGVLLDQESYERRNTSRLDRREPREWLKSWKMIETPLSRSDSNPLGEPPTACTPAKSEIVDRLVPHLPKRAKVPSDQWIACTLDDSAHLLATTGSECGKEWYIAVVDKEGELWGLESGKESSTHLRLRRIDDETMLVEQWGSKDTPRLFHADSGSLVQVDGTFGLSLRPPSGCRKRCTVEFSDLGAGT